jgi:hypothetical protein
MLSKALLSVHAMSAPKNILLILSPLAEFRAQQIDGKQKFFNITYTCVFAKNLVFWASINVKRFMYIYLIQVDSIVIKKNYKDIIK